MLINFYCFTSHACYFRLEIYNKTIIGFTLWFSPLEMYNITIRNYAIMTIRHFSVFAKHFLYLYGLCYAETQCNILIIVILLQPEMERHLNSGSGRAKTAGALAGLRPFGAQPYLLLKVSLKYSLHSLCYIYYKRNIKHFPY